MEEQSLIRLGVLNGTFGLKGDLRCRLDSAAVPLLRTPCRAWIGYSASFAAPVRLEDTAPRPGALICTLEGIDTREKATELLEQALFVEPESIVFEEPKSDPGLVGFDVVDQAGEPLGKIIAIFRTPAHYIWTVEQEGGEEWMVPAIDEFVLEIQQEARRAVVRPIPGLLGEEPENDEEG